jgi:predicted metal-binding protein
MLKFPAPFPNAIFVCTHKRPDGHPKPCCADRGGNDVRDKLKEMVKAKGLEGQVRVFRSGCLGGCERGIMAVKYPAGELMMDVKQEDLQQILDEAIGEK